MTILNNIKGMLGVVSPASQEVNSGSIPYKSGVKVSLGDAAYDTEAEVIAFITGTAHSAYLKIWEMTVPPQQLIHWGFGSPALPYNQGFMWFASLDITTDWDVGILRLVQANARETKIYVVAEFADSGLHSTTVTSLATAQPTLQAGGATPLAEKVEFPWIGEDSKLQLTYRLITAATAHDHVGFDIPISVRQ